MTRFRASLSVIAAVLVGAAIFGAPGQAQAGFAARYKLDGAADYTAITLNSAGHGTVTISGAEVTIDVSGLALGSLDMSLIITNIQSPLKAIFEGTITGYNVPGTDPMFGGSGTFHSIETAFTGNNLASASVSAVSWADTANSEFGQTTPTSVPLKLNGDGGNFTFSGSGLFSLTTQITVNATTGGLGVDSNNYVTSVNPVPVPNGLILMVGAVPFLSLAVRRRRQLAA